MKLALFAYCILLMKKVIYFKFYYYNFIERRLSFLSLSGIFIKIYLDLDLQEIENGKNFLINMVNVKKNDTEMKN